MAADRRYSSGRLSMVTTTDRQMYQCRGDQLLVVDGGVMLLT